VKGTAIRSTGGRSILPEPRTNCLLFGLMAYAIIELGKPVKYYLGRKSCVMLACDSDRGGLITIERFWGEFREGWAVFYDGIPCAMDWQMRCVGVVRQSGRPAIYNTVRSAAACAKYAFRIDMEAKD